MKLEHLKLSNFRGFHSFEISFDRQFTVLLGSNMAGKTAVLDGVGIALGAFLRRGEIEDDDIRQTVSTISGVPDLQGQFPVTVEAQAQIQRSPDRSIVWQFYRTEADASTRTVGEHFNVLNLPPATELPIIAKYGTRRHWRKGDIPADLRGIGSRYDAYDDCFNVQFSHGEFAGWMRKQTLVQLQRAGGYIQPQLAAVEAAVKCCIDKATRFWFDVQYDELRLELNNGDIQSFAMLSEGYRNIVAMIADIAWRTAVLNPGHGSEAHLLTEGVVLIDELDLHLHPAWQRRIVADLRRTFPKIQFVITTHSPQIVASVSRTQVRLLDQNRLIGEAPHVEGRDANEILEDVFGVSKRPETIQAEIDAMYRLIEDEDFTTARVRLANLQHRLGPNDEAIVRARWILDTEEAQINRQPSSQP